MLNAKEKSYDVIVVGGGFAGIGAVIGARQTASNANILLIESEACLGGAATHRGVMSVCGIYTCDSVPRQAVGGVWNLLHPLLVKGGGSSARPTQHRGVFLVVEPEVLKLCLDLLLVTYNIEVLLHTRVVGARRSSTQELAAVEIQDHNSRYLLHAKAFVDCSGECDLAYYGEASVRYGNNGAVNLGSLSTRFGGLSQVDPTTENWKNAILSAKAANPSLISTIPKNSSVLLRLPQSRDIVTYLASADYDARDSASHTKAEQQGRAQAQEYLEILRTLPGHEGMYLVSTGPNFGTRESRHINARYQLQRSDVLGGRRFEDVIAVGGWGLEWHDATTEDWSSTFQLAHEGCFEIPLRSLQSRDTYNLFAAGRCIDGDQCAGSASRVLGTAMATGQAAGIAAALVSVTSTAPDIKDVQKILTENGALLDIKSLPPAGPIGRP